MPDAEATPLTSSVIGRLLDELSWVGKSIRDYRRGGIGYENVLVAETLLALDFLPRSRFLGTVLRAAHGADAARASAVDDIEASDLVVLPPEVKLRPSAESYQQQLVVQPDASLVGPHTHTLIEAKRLRQGSFQQEQLAREFVAVTREAGSRIPLLLLIIPTPPPVPIKKLGRMSPEQAIASSLVGVVDQTEHHPSTLEDLAARIAEVVAWITWDELGSGVERARSEFETADSSIAGTVNRLCDLIADSLHRHR
ncbi:hypothetical protein [uncultured Jatrophihabitans sp.]|uniref:hypothetical protein n=1 Tax=uncultured Jatrophihabitans sp. TaxID=1610747 RepID=UPI0035CA3F04